MTAFTSIKHLKKDFLRGITTCTKIVDTCLQTIKQNLRLNAFLKIFESEALDKAAMIDRKIDNASSKIFNRYKSRYTNNNLISFNI